MGIERILRYLLEKRFVNIPKSPAWHKELLLNAKNESLITPQQFDSLMNLLLFRHLQIHGYGHNLNETRLKELAAPVPGLCKLFFQNLE